MDAHQQQTLQMVLDIWKKFCWNFRTIGTGEETYPEFIDKVKWPIGDRDEALSEWHKVCYQYNCGGSDAIHLYYLSLNPDNRQALIEYVFSKSL